MRKVHHNHRSYNFRQAGYLSNLMYPLTIIVVKLIILLPPNTPAFGSNLRHTPVIRTQMQIVREVFHTLFTLTT